MHTCIIFHCIFALLNKFYNFALSQKLICNVSHLSSCAHGSFAKNFRKILDFPQKLSNAEISQYIVLLDCTVQYNNERKQCITAQCSTIHVHYTVHLIQHCTAVMHIMQ